MSFRNDVCWPFAWRPEFRRGSSVQLLVRCKALLPVVSDSARRGSDGRVRNKTDHSAINASGCRLFCVSWRSRFAERPGPLQVPPHKFNALFLPKLPQILNALFAEINVLHIRYILRRCSRHPASNDNRIRLEHNSIVHGFVNRQCD